MVGPLLEGRRAVQRLLQRFLRFAEASKPTLPVALVGGEQRSASTGGQCFAQKLADDDAFGRRWVSGDRSSDLRSQGPNQVGIDSGSENPFLVHVVLALMGG